MMAQSSKRSLRAREEFLKRDAQLDEALIETFPASDPIAVGRPTATERPRRPVDRKVVLPAPATKVVEDRAKRKRRAPG